MSQAQQVNQENEFIDDLESAVESARNYLLRIQNPDGYWCGELEGDTILESEYILAMYFLGRGAESRISKAAEYIRRKALPDGGWAIYPGGSPEVSASVKAYFVLKLLGEDPDSPLMLKALKVIRDLGGLAAVNSFTGIYLAIFGQYPWELCPAVPPEIALLPTWFPINLYEMSAWSRCIVVPLSLIWAFKPHCDVPREAGIRELWTQESLPSRAGSAWKKFFRVTDTTLKFFERHRWTPFRSAALKACEKWMLEHFTKSDGLGAIFPPIVNSIFALRSLGYEKNHPVLQAQIHELEKLEIEEIDTLRVAPCYSPVWDTALAVTALGESGMEPDDPALLKAGEWLLDKEVQDGGDWKVKNPEGPTGGWYFEFANEFYPDVDDTFQVLIALSKIRFIDQETEKRKRNAMDRAYKWTLSMQNEDGGWASFDRGCDREFLTQIPFADHNAMIDPGTLDITARGLESLATLELDRENRAMQLAINFVLKEQEPEGCWFGRWGCNYIYGTWLAMRAAHILQFGGEASQRGAEWLRSVQNTDGGWGELPRSYEDAPTKGKGPSTPSQTAWALMGLMATEDYDSLQVRKGVDYLLRMQKDDGSWKDDFWTGTGFPKVFYLRYHLYATYFPLFALGLFQRSNQLSRQPI